MPTLTPDVIKVAVTAFDPQVATATLTVSGDELDVIEAIQNRWAAAGLAAFLTGGLFTGGGFGPGREIAVPEGTVMPYGVIEPLVLSWTGFTNTSEYLRWTVRVNVFDRTFEKVGAHANRVRPALAFAPLRLAAQDANLLDVTPVAVRYLQEDEAVWRGQLEFQVNWTRPANYNPS